jgi:hypothetical protein
VYGPTPPVTVTVIVPSLKPLQLTAVTAGVIVGVGIASTVIVVVAVQAVVLLASVTVNTYSPATAAV